MLLTNTIFLKTSRRRRAEKRRERYEWLLLHPPKPTPKPKVKRIHKVEIEPESERIKNVYRMRRYRTKHDLCEVCFGIEPICTHHVIPFSEGGEDVDDNYLALCKDCHTGKHPEMAAFMGANDYIYNRRELE